MLLKLVLLLGAFQELEVSVLKLFRLKRHLFASERSPLRAIVTFPRMNRNGIEMEPGNPIT